MGHRAWSRRHASASATDISSVAFWSSSFEERDVSFAKLRAHDPVSWQPALETPGLASRYEEPGFWAVCTAAEIRHVSTHHELFSSERGQVNVRPKPFWIAENMLVLDPPRHTVYRQVLNHAFAARSMRRLEPLITSTARTLVRAMLRVDEFDLVRAVSSAMPVRTVAHLLGVPLDQHDRFVRLVATYLSSGVGAVVPEGTDHDTHIAQQGQDLRQACLDLAAWKRRHPADDLMTRLVEARVDGSPLTEEALASTVLLLVVAGSDTTTHATTLAYLALEQFPEQRAWLVQDWDRRFDQAFEELVRHASPVISFARTATEDTRLGDRLISAGDKVALFYCSGNRDESVFPDPSRLDLQRPPRQHVAFGGGGVHFCLGSTLARMQIKAVLAELYRAPRLHVGPPTFGVGEEVRSVLALPVAW